jgi:hypothetical protein
MTYFRVYSYNENNGIYKFDAIYNEWEPCEYKGYSIRKTIPTSSILPNKCVKDVSAMIEG